MASQIDIKDKIEKEVVFKIEPFRKKVLKTNPHKHNNYFELIYLSKGSGIHYIDLNKYPITPPVLFLIRQEQVHCWEFNSEPDGYVIIIKKAFVEKSLDSELKSFLVKISSQCCLQVPDNNTIQKLFALLIEENKGSGVNSYQIVEGLLKSLLAKVLEVSNPIINKAEVKSDVYQSFIQLLIADNGLKNKVNHYAEKLHTSPQNLNAACQKTVHKSAAHVLSEFVIMETKRLLLYTDMTVSEVSFTLEFSDPSHFIKYFKKFVGSTPQVFRSNRN
jgi:AraC family transcriptional activator of pobA